MLKHGVPWQAILGVVFVLTISFVLAMSLGLLSGYFNWHPVLTAICLLLGFLIIIALIPTLLNLSRSYFLFILLLFIVHVCVSIISFALHYKSSGLIISGNIEKVTFYDSLYFSITTFTTLGYGDFQPLPGNRLTTSIEALLGMFSMAIGASIIWLWCQENLLPKEMAFFDGNRRHKKDLSITRMRIRTITGKERNLKDWVLPPEEGDSFYYDKTRQEWVKINNDIKELPENTLVIGFKDE